MNFIINRIHIASPCKDCEERHIGCHSECERYADYRKRIDAQRATIQENLGKEYQADDHVRDTARRGSKK